MILMTVFMVLMGYFKIDREKGITDSYSQIPEAEILDYWDEDSEYIIYSNLDKIKDWFKKIWRFFVF